MHGEITQVQTGFTAAAFHWLTATHVSGWGAPLGYHGDLFRDCRKGCQSAETPLRLKSASSLCLPSAPRSGVRILQWTLKSRQGLPLGVGVMKITQEQHSQFLTFFLVVHLTLGYDINGEKRFYFGDTVGVDAPGDSADGCAFQAVTGGSTCCYSCACQGEPCACGPGLVEHPQACEGRNSGDCRTEAPPASRPFFVDRKHHFSSWSHHLIWQVVLNFLEFKANRSSPF